MRGEKGIVEAAQGGDELLIIGARLNWKNIYARAAQGTTIQCIGQGIDIPTGTTRGIDEDDSRQAGNHDISGWAELLDRWRSQLEGLGAEFVGGEAAVIPADPKKTCQYCDLFPLCRIDEIARLSEDTE
jgi:hypothetical protein